MHYGTYPPSPRLSMITKSLTQIGIFANVYLSPYHFQSHKNGDLSMALTKHGIAEQLHLRLDISKRKALKTAETLLEIIKSTLESGDDVLVSGFGKFCVKEKAVRRGRNPATGSDMMLPARRVVTFKWSGKLRDKINRKMKIVSEKRQYPRRTAYIIAEYTVLEGTFRDFIRNIGAGGLFISTDRKVAVGQPVSIRFPLFNFDNFIQITGRIVRRDRKGFAVIFNEAIKGLICKDGHFPEIVHEGDHPTES